MKISFKIRLIFLLVVLFLLAYVLVGFDEGVQYKDKSNKKLKVLDDKNFAQKQKEEKIGGLFHRESGGSSRGGSGGGGVTLQNKKSADEVVEEIISHAGVKKEDVKKDIKELNGKSFEELLKHLGDSNE